MSFRLHPHPAPQCTRTLKIDNAEATPYGLASGNSNKQLFIPLYSHQPGYTKVLFIPE